jgi:hypothetical protein
VTCVTRGKVSVDFTRVGLRDVLLPSERMPFHRVPAAQSGYGAAMRLLGNEQPRLVPWNRERELGLDRRETG